MPPLRKQGPQSEEEGVGMPRYYITMMLATLATGILLLYLAGGPLGVLFFILVWVDTLFILKTGFPKAAGIELLTIAAIIGGITFGPVGGFLVGMLAIPIMVLLLFGIVNRYWLIRETPNIDYLYAGIAAATAGLLSGFLPFMFIVIIALAVRFLFSALINKTIFGTASLDYAFVNILFSLLVLFLLNSAGIVGAVA
jgi:hypothetical protein